MGASARLTMQDLLHLLADQLFFFLDPHGYRIVNSQVGSSYRDGLIDLTKDQLTWRLRSDRSQKFLACRPTDGPEDRWYSTDLLVRLLTGSRADSADRLTSEVVEWVEAHLDEIEDRFTPGRKEESLRELQALKRKRAKELFG